MSEADLTEIGLRTADDAPPLVKSVLDGIPDPAAWLTPDRRVRRINRPGVLAIRSYLGEHARIPIGRTPADFLEPLGPAFEGLLDEVQRIGQPETRCDVVVRCEPHASKVWLDLTAIPLREAHQDFGFVVVARDRTRDRILIEQLRRERDFSALILERTGALVVVLDREGRIVEFNPVCERVTGYTRDEALGRRVWDFLLTPEETQPVQGVFAELRSGQFPNQFENFWVTKDGRKRRIAWTNSAILGPNGEVVNVIGTGQDVTEAREREERLRHDAMHDPLTGLANRNLLMELLRLNTHRSARDPQYRFGVLYCDLDGFKEVNDRYGHPFGDQVLVQVADRLRRATRRSDTVARVGGDEFVVLADSVHDGEGLRPIADRILTGFRDPFEANGTSIVLTVSLGGAIGSAEHADPEALLALADQAMYRSKRSGKARSTFVTRTTAS